MIDGEEESKRKCVHEGKAILHRWEEESDLDQEDILECVSEALEEYYDEEVVDFESDICLDDEQGMELGEDEEGG
mgnify:CR=1 FL=1